MRNQRNREKALAWFALSLVTPGWFDGRFKSDVEPYLVRLLLGVFPRYLDGELTSKKQAMRLMGVVDPRTAERYISLAQRQRLVTVTRSKIDKRVQYTCPTDAAIELIGKELSKFERSLRDIQEIEPADDGVSDVTWLLGRDPFHTTLEWLTTEVSQANEAVRLIGQSPGAWARRGLANLQTGWLLLRQAKSLDAREALRKSADDYANAVKMAPSNSFYRFALVSALALQEHHAEALAVLDDMIENKIAADGAYLYRAHIYRDLGDIDKAKESLRASNVADRDFQRWMLPTPD